MKRLDNLAIENTGDDIFVFSRIRNELLRLPWFLDYYRKQGADRFFIVDNDSSDGSTEYLLSQNDVHLFHTSDSYAAANSGTDWLNILLKEYASSHWAITVDPDEIFIYPGYETFKLKQLIEYLDIQNYTAVNTVMIDMYSDKAIRDTVYPMGTDFLQVCPFFDKEVLSSDMRGGPRKRLFWKGNQSQGNPPYLKKLPMVKWNKALFYKCSTHLIDNVKPANIQGVLLHFKFFNDFYAQVITAVKEKQYWDNSVQYNQYLSTMFENPGITPFYEGSVRYRNSFQMVELGFMKDSDTFKKFREKSKKN